MREGYKKGVDGAIAVLLVLARRNAPTAVADLAHETGIARSSLYRIVRTLSASGLVESTDALVAAGEVARTLVASHAEKLRREDKERRQRIMRGMRRVPSSQQPVPAMDRPLALSLPKPIRRRGRFRIGFSNASNDNPWRVALVHSVEWAAAKLSDTMERLIVRHAEDDADRQAADIAALCDSGVDGLIVSALNARSVHDAIDHAARCGVAIVLVDRGIPPDRDFTSFVTTDDANIGRMTALWLSEILEGKGGVLLLPGLRDAEPAKARLAAARAVFSEFSGITPLMVGWTGWRADRAHGIVRRAIGRWGEAIQGVWCDSGLQGVGSIRAFIDAGRGPGTVPPHTGGDLNLAYKLAIKSRTPLAAVDYPPAMGMRAVEVLFSALRGRAVPRFVTVPSEVILTRGAATRSVKPNLWAEKHVRWDLPDDLVLAAGLGPAYDPRSFRIHYPGNVYNRSAAQRPAP